MARIPLTDEETRVILFGEAGSNLRDLDAGQQQQVLKRLLDVMETPQPPSAHVHEQIGNLDIIAAGDKCRLYTKVVDNLPRDNTTYHIIFVFYIDESHDYPDSELSTYHGVAQSRANQVTDLTTVDDVEAYLERHDALSPDDIRSKLPD